MLRAEEGLDPCGSLAASLRRSAALEQAIHDRPNSFRVLTGDRPTGPLHIGHYFGTLQNRVRLQQLGVELLVLVADYQVLTDRDATGDLPRRVEEQVADYLAVGIDPARAMIFAHSQVPALNQLLLPFLGLVSVGELARNPTTKDEAVAARTTSALMFTYPAHQAADILFCHANVIPVGRDQLPHVELTRTIARRFNERYGGGRPFFPEPDALLSETPLLLGLDGRKMGKSHGNSIPLAGDADDTARLIRRAKTDSERRIAYEPERRPEVANLLRIVELCTKRPAEEIAAEIGDGGAKALKEVVAEALNDHLRPIRLRRSELLRDRGQLRSLLRDGSRRANEIAEQTLAAVHDLMHTSY